MVFVVVAMELLRCSVAQLFKLVAREFYGVWSGCSGVCYGV